MGRSAHRHRREDDRRAFAARLRRLQVARGAVAASAVAAVLATGTLPSPAAAAATGLWLVGTTVLALVGARRGPATALAPVSLLLDTAWLAVIGLLGPPGGLAPLLSLHVVAVALLLSTRLGLAVAVVDGLVFVATIAVGATGPATAALAPLPLVLLAGGVGWGVTLRERALRARERALADLLDLAERLEAAEAASEVAEAALAHLTDVVGFRRAALVDGRPAGSGGEARSEGSTRTRGGATTSLLLPGAPSSRLVVGATGVPVRLRSIDPDADPVLDALLPWATGVSVVPLVPDRSAPALLAAEWGGGRRHPVPPEATDALGRVARHVAVSLAKARSRADVEWLATRDALTGLVNRRVLDEALGWATSAAGRTGDPLSLVLLDLDDFKAVNDRHGHLAGDEVLRAAGHALLTASRGSDVAARFGGEELAVLLPGCPPDAALAIAERLRVAVGSPDGPVRVTASAGVATLPGDATTPEGLLRAADRALYRAKREGRDRTVAAGTVAAAVVADLRQGALEAVGG